MYVRTNISHVRAFVPKAAAAKAAAAKAAEVAAAQAAAAQVATWEKGYNPIWVFPKIGVHPNHPIQ